MNEKRQHSQETEARRGGDGSLLAKAMSPRGRFDSKIFASKSRITYTFIDKDDVVILHFDCDRKAIYYKGHNFANLELNKKYSHYLDIFMSVMESTESCKKFLASFKDVYHSLLKSNGNQTDKDNSPS